MGKPETRFGRMTFQFVSGKTKQKVKCLQDKEVVGRRLSQNTDLFEKINRPDMLFPLLSCSNTDYGDVQS